LVPSPAGPVPVTARRAIVHRPLKSGYRGPGRVTRPGPFVSPAAGSVTAGVSLEPRGAPEPGRGDAEARLEDAAEMGGAGKAPVGGDLGDGMAAEPVVGEVVPAPAQPFLADPGAEADAFAREEPVELADREIARPGGGPGGKTGVGQVRERVPFQLPGQPTAAQVPLVGEAGRGPQRAGGQVQPGVDEPRRRRIAGRPGLPGQGPQVGRDELPGVAGGSPTSRSASRRASRPAFADSPPGGRPRTGGVRLRIARRPGPA
jgi:hypothetical protein